MFYRINLFNLLTQNSNDNSCVFLYYMREVPNVGYKDIVGDKLGFVEKYQSRGSTPNFYPGGE